MFTQEVQLPDTVGAWSFDMEGCLDSSGNRNHAWASCSRGIAQPGRSGIGTSLELSNSNFLSIPASQLYDTEPFTVQLWVFWNYNSASQTWCPILQKGKDTGPPADTVSAYERFPALMLNTRTSQLEALLSTTVSSKVGHSHALRASL